MTQPTATPFDAGMQAFMEFWSQAGKAAVHAQETAARAFSDAMKAAPGMLPGMAGAAPGAVPGAVPGVDASAAARAGEAMAELWKSAAGMFGTLTQALTQAGAGGGRDTDPAVQSAFQAMSDPRNWLTFMGGMDSVAGKVADAPQLADLWNAERQQARLAAAWLDVRRRGLEHNAVVLEAWLRAAREFSDELAGRTAAEGRAPEGKALLALWTETANRVLLEMQRSEPFLRTQAAAIRAGTGLRLAQQDLAERWADAFGLPTRTELDDVHRTVTELRREVRRLRRDADARGNGAGAASRGTRAGKE